MSACASCGAELAPSRDGPGRPATYCGEPCRRVVEFRIRMLLRHIDKHETALREIKARTGKFFFVDDDERRRTTALYRRWLAEDEAKLRELLGAPAPQKPRKEKRK